MNEKELFKFGEHELNTNSLIKNIQSNYDSFVNYYSNRISDPQLFSEKLEYIKNGIKDGSITVDKDGKYADAKGKINDNDQLMQYALGYVNLIATEQSKKERSLTNSEIAKQEEAEKLRKAELERQRLEKEEAQRNVKPDFTPQDGWSVASSFAHSFNQNGQIPYDLLQQLVTQDDNGNSVYTDLHAQLDKNFDYVSKQLQQYNNTESYVNNINLFKQALKDGDLSPQDRFLGMELGFQNSELDKLNNLIKYKIKPTDPTPPEEKKEEEEVTTPVIELKQDPLESDDDFHRRVEASQRTKNYVINALKHINFNQFNSSEPIKLDSESEFKKYLIQYINSELLKTQNPNFVQTKYYGTPFGPYQNMSLIQKINEDHLQYMDPKLYNELGLKFFSKYSKSNMYKYFKDLVDKQNREKIVEKIEYDDPTRDLSAQYMFKEGGIIKAQGGTQTPWRRNFDQGAHQMDVIYDTFTKNANSYDAKLIAESLNKLNTDEFSSLNFAQDDNTLGFKNWNTTFNESGLNNLFGYNEGKSDYLGPTTKSRQGFVSYLQNLYDPSNPNKVDQIKTGNGSLVFNPETKQWSYTDWVDPASKNTNTEGQQGDGQGSENGSDDGGTGDGNGSTGTGVLPEVGELSLKALTLKKKANLNKNGILQSLAGYIANDYANEKKRELAKQIPLYQEVAAPEKTFKTPYTYDLEQAKNKAFAEANSIQPLTSDVSAYYVAKNDAIKNARDYAERLDFKINDLIHEASDYNRGVAYENAVSRTTNTNTNAKYRHQWKVEQLDFEDQFIDAKNKSFQGLLKESKYNTVMAQRRKQQLQDHYTNKSLLTSIKTSPSDYIDKWTKHHDDIWTRGQNNQLTTTQEQIEYAQLLSLVGQAYDNAYAQYTGIDYVGAGNLSVSDVLKEQFDPKKHGVAVVGAKGTKLNRSRINDFLNKIK